MSLLQSSQTAQLSLPSLCTRTRAAFVCRCIHTLTRLHRDAPLASGAAEGGWAEAEVLICLHANAMNVSLRWRGRACKERFNHTSAPAAIIGCRMSSTRHAHAAAAEAVRSNSK